MNTSRRNFMKTLGLGAAALALPRLSGSAATVAPPPQNRPNFVFILADDYGFMDTGFNGSRFYETPNLDRLAAEGMRFTEGYAACPVCSPTRASIVTGKYPARLHLTEWIGGGARRGKLLPAEYLHQLPLEETTLAEAFQEAGYATCFVGKWHLGDEPFWPDKQGFAQNIAGTQAGSPRSYFSPYQNPNLTDGPKGEYLTDRLTAEAEKFIAAQAGKQPFLLYLSHYAVHTPLQAKEELRAKYAAKAAANPAPEPKFLPEGPNNMARQVQDHDVYGAMVQSLDESVGRVMRKLEEAGVAENTVFFFMSDNGGLSTSEGSPTSNLPLRAGKGWLYEGGIREPLVIKWPGVVRPGSIWNEPVVSTDFYPTMLEMAGLPPRPAQHCDGLSLVPLLRDGKAPVRQAIFWHYPHYSNQGGAPGAAVRSGDWKLIRFYEDDRQELYNIRQDIGEKTDLAAQNPEKIRELAQLLDAFLKDTAATMPTPNPDWAPGQPPGKSIQVGAKKANAPAAPKKAKGGKKKAVR